MTPNEVAVHWDWPRLSDSAVVVRGGQMFVDDMAYNAAHVLLESGLSAICGGSAGRGVSARQIALRMPYKGDWYCVARLGSLRAEGFDIVMIDTPPHCLILLNSEDTSIDWDGWERLRSAFSQPRSSKPPR